MSVYYAKEGQNNGSAWEHKYRIFINPTQFIRLYAWGNDKAEILEVAKKVHKDTGYRVFIADSLYTCCEEFEQEER